MLTGFTDEYLQVMRLVALMLLIPLDTSECERLFSLMNDLKTAERSRLDTETLKNLMIWNYVLWQEDLSGAAARSPDLAGVVHSVQGGWPPQRPNGSPREQRRRPSVEADLRCGWEQRLVR